jgi:hypothetical protein
MTTPLREAIQASSTFLSISVTTETGLPLLQRLHGTIPASWTSPQPSLSEQSKIVLYAIELLQRIHTAALNENVHLGIKDWRHINALVEIIIILGLYKSVSSGVGLPENRRVNSVLLSREGQTNGLSESERELLLQSIISNFVSFMEQASEIGDILRRKHLVDILSGMAELSFNPSYAGQERLPWKTQYEALLARFK